MGHVVTVPPRPFEACGGRAKVVALPAAKDNLVWVLICTATQRAAVIDGPDATAAKAFFAAHPELNWVAVWNTHTHSDHVGINRDIGPDSGLEIAGRGVPHQTLAVDEGDVLRLGELQAKVWRTEGHLNGHLSFVLDDLVFCGDTLFAGGCGYLFDGPAETMFASLMRLASLPPETRVCCAHEYTEDNMAFAAWIEPSPAVLARQQEVAALRSTGACTVPSTIADERASNPFLRPGAPLLVANVVEHGMDASSPAAVFASARELKNQKLYKRPA